MIDIQHARYKINEKYYFSLPALHIDAGQHTAFIGSNGSGKSLLAKAMANQLQQIEGTYHSDFRRLMLLSFEQLQTWVTEEWERNNTDLVSEHDLGMTTAEMISADAEDPTRLTTLATQFGITHLLSRQFTHLSTGETRKALLCRALLSEPDLLILDEPFDGLDTASRAQLAQLLAELATQNITLILILNRIEEIPAFISRVGWLENQTITQWGTRNDILQRAFRHPDTTRATTLPEPDEAPDPLPPEIPRIVLRNGQVSYQQNTIIQGLTWQVNTGEHWQISGPNGAGKSTLLSLITGDHPQGYSNDLHLFGRRRGSGETIWDIKKRIGYVSNQLQLDYRASASVRNVLLSGYFDSIGLYQTASDKQRHLVGQWLDLLGLTAQADFPFQSLSWGQQRIVLIARALVKHPALLILDEPLQGLDSFNRDIVTMWIDYLMTSGKGRTQLLFVSHHAEDAPACITHHLRFVPTDDGYRYEIKAGDM